jgi:hypothetical protein
MKAKILSVIKDEGIKNWQIFLMMVVLNIFVVLITNTFLLTRETYHTLLSSQMESYQIDNYYMIVKHYTIYGYLFLPLILMIRAIGITMLIQLFFLISQKNLKFREVFRVALFGLGVLSLCPLVKVLWLISLPQGQLTGITMSITPLSLSSVINISNMDGIIIGAMNCINIFEVMWVLVVGYLIKSFFDMTLRKSIACAFGVWALIFVFQMSLALYMTRVFHG